MLRKSLGEVMLSMQKREGGIEEVEKQGLEKRREEEQRSRKKKSS